MKKPDQRYIKDLRSRRYKRDTLAFSRILNLSDAVFAIAMTLLVLNIDRPDVAGYMLAGALLNQMPQFIAFILSFALVANLWWQHHKLVEIFGLFEPVMIAINLAILGAVVIVPFPTSLIGSQPRSHTAVIFFIAIFIVISLLYMLLLVRAQVTRAWRHYVSKKLFYWMLLNWGSGIAVMIIAIVLAIWIPVGGLVIMAVSIILGPFASLRHYKKWT